MVSLTDVVSPLLRGAVQTASFDHQRTRDGANVAIAHAVAVIRRKEVDQHCDARSHLKLPKVEERVGGSKVIGSRVAPPKDLLVAFEEPRGVQIVPH